MNVLLDTSVWSLALRRQQRANRAVFQEVSRLIDECRVEIIGAIRQELLSGLRDEKQFTRLNSYLEAFPDLHVETEDYVLAARFFDTCRSNGIQGSNTDFLICAVANRHDFAIYTTDKDFGRLVKALPVKLHAAGG